MGVGDGRWNSFVESRKCSAPVVGRTGQVDKRGLPRLIEVLLTGRIPGTVDVIKHDASHAERVFHGDGG